MKGLLGVVSVLWRSVWYYSLFAIGISNQFSLPTISGMWSSPLFSGTRPPPCAHFSLTTVDDHRAVLFAGFQGGVGASNDVYILDVAAKVSCDGGPLGVSRL